MSLKMHAQLSSWARCLNFSLSLHLQPYFACASSKGSGKHASLLLTVAFEIPKPTQLYNESNLHTMIICFNSYEHLKDGHK